MGDVPVRVSTEWALCLRQVLRRLEAKLRTLSKAVKQPLVLEVLLALIPVSTALNDTYILVF